MNKPKIESVTTVLIAIIAVIAILNVWLSDKDNICQREVLFLLANNSELLYRSEVFSNMFINMNMFHNILNSSNDSLDNWGHVFNDLQASVWNYRDIMDNKITDCSKVTLWKNILLAAELIISLIVLYCTIIIYHKSR